MRKKKNLIKESMRYDVKNIIQTSTMEYESFVNDPYCETNNAPFKHAFVSSFR